MPNVAGGKTLILGALPLALAMGLGRKGAILESLHTGPLHQPCYATANESKSGSSFYAGRVYRQTVLNHTGSLPPSIQAYIRVGSAVLLLYLLHGQHLWTFMPLYDILRVRSDSSDYYSARV